MKKKQQVVHLEMRSGEPELGSCSCFCHTCSSTNLHEEVWTLGRSWRNGLQPSQWEGGQNCCAPVAKQTCKPVPKRCEDAGGNSRTICQGELREQFHSSRWGSCQQPGKHWRALSWLLAALTKPDRRPSAPRESLERDRGTRPWRTFRVGQGTFPHQHQDSEEGCSSRPVRHDVRPPFSRESWSDVLRRLVGRTMAKQVTKEVEAATSNTPCQLDQGASAWHTCCKPSPS